jgi:anti-repressor protein
MADQTFNTGASPNAMLPLAFEGATVRIVDRGGEPWFVAKDVACVLGYANPQKAIRDHCKAAVPVGGERGVHPGVLDPQTILIPERDVYRLIMRSKLPAAERFEEWVVGVVLPAVRRTGRYEAQEALGGLSAAEIRDLVAETVGAILPKVLEATLPQLI